MLRTGLGGKEGAILPNYALLKSIVWRTPKAAIAHAAIGRSCPLRPSPIILVPRGNPATTAGRNVVLGPLGNRSPLADSTDVIRSREGPLSVPSPQRGPLHPSYLLPFSLVRSRGWRISGLPLSLPCNPAASDTIFSGLGAVYSVYPTAERKSREEGEAHAYVSCSGHLPFPHLLSGGPVPPLCIFFSRNKTDKRTPSLVPCARCCRCQYGSHQLWAPECGPLLHAIGKDRNATAIEPSSFARPGPSSR